jgi:hypothetical protein
VLREGIRVLAQALVEREVAGRTGIPLTFRGVAHHDYRRAAWCGWSK